RPRASSGSSGRSHRRALPTRRVSSRPASCRPRKPRAPLHGHDAGVYCLALAAQIGKNPRPVPRRTEPSVQDPFYHKQKRKKQTRMLDADAALDTAIYEFWQAVGRGWTRVQDFFSMFRVGGFKRVLVELLSDGLSFGAIGGVVALALA